MQETDLLLSLAEIAGVFVGFATLIAVRSGGASDVREVAYMRAVVWMAMMTIVAALAPVILGRYGLPEHQVWALSSALVLVGYFGMVAFNVRTPEVKAVDAASSRRWQVIESVVSIVLFAIPTILALGAILVGLAPDLDAALYSTIVVLILLGSAFTLLELVYSQRRAATA